MITITYDEMVYLTKIAKVPFGEGGVSRTYGHNHSYYLCESPTNKKILKEYYTKIGRDPETLDKKFSLKGR